MSVYKNINQHKKSKKFPDKALTNIFSLVYNKNANQLICKLSNKNLWRKK